MLTEPGWFLLTASLMLHFEEFVSSFSHPGTNGKAFETGMDVVLCETRREKGGGGERKKNPVCMPLPGRTLQGFGYECVTVHVCVYFGEITMGGCVFSLHGKTHFVDCVENRCHVSFLLPARLCSSSTMQAVPCGPHGGAVTQHQLPLQCS